MNLRSRTVQVLDAQWGCWAIRVGKSRQGRTSGKCRVENGDGNTDRASRPMGLLGLYQGGWSYTGTTIWLVGSSSEYTNGANDMASGVKVY